MGVAVIGRRDAATRGIAAALQVEVVIAQRSCNACSVQYRLHQRGVTNMSAAIDLFLGKLQEVAAAARLVLPPDWAERSRHALWAAALTAGISLEVRRRSSVLLVCLAGPYTKPLCIVFHIVDAVAGLPDL